MDEKKWTRRKTTDNGKKFYLKVEQEKVAAQSCRSFT